jgi:hypothetical protein
LGNNPWAGNNSSIISSLLKKNSRTFRDLISPQGLSRPGFFENKFKDFPGFSRTVGTLSLVGMQLSEEYKELRLELPASY